MMKNILIHGLGQNSQSWDNTSMSLKVSFLYNNLDKVDKNKTR